MLLVEKYSVKSPAGPKVVHPTPWTPELKEEKRIHMTDRVGLARVYIVWPTPRQFTAKTGRASRLAGFLRRHQCSGLRPRGRRSKALAGSPRAFARVDGDANPAHQHPGAPGIVRHFDAQGPDTLDGGTGSSVPGPDCRLARGGAGLRRRPGSHRISLHQQLVVWDALVVVAAASRERSASTRKTFRTGRSFSA